VLYILHGLYPSVDYCNAPMVTLL